MTTTAAVAAMALGCAQQQSGPSVVIEDKVYAVTPDSVSVKTGIMTGQVTEMKVTERIEKGSGNVVSPAKLTGKLLLKNSSADQTVRLIEGKIQFIDDQGQPIKVEEKRVAPTFKFSGYDMAGGSIRGRRRPGCDGLRRGLAGEEAEDDPPRARVSALFVSGRDGEPRGVDRRQVGRR
jgi:hypothetical protein